jgi:hypothetical protein
MGQDISIDMVPDKARVEAADKLSKVVPFKWLGPGVLYRQIDGATKIFRPGEILHEKAHLEAVELEDLKAWLLQGKARLFSLVERVIAGVKIITESPEAYAGEPITDDELAAAERLANQTRDLNDKAHKLAVEALKRKIGAEEAQLEGAAPRIGTLDGGGIQQH